MKSIKKSFGELKFKKLEKCNPKQGYSDSCTGCKHCGKNRFESEGDVIAASYELREDGDIELREDGGYELRQPVYA